MTQIEVIEKLYEVSLLLMDIIKEQSNIIAQHDIEIEPDNLTEKITRAEKENEEINTALHGI